MRPYSSFLFEEQQPDAKLVQKELNYVIGVILGGRANGDWEHTLTKIPIKKIITRERGFRYKRDALVTAFTKTPNAVTPIAIQPGHGSKYHLLDGHHRLRSAKDAGAEYIWAIVIGDKTNAESDTLCVCGHTKRYHNGSTMFGWDDCLECKCKKFKLKS
jgi:hypothetical protein